MALKHPALPDHRPLAIAHRGGNGLDAARAALGYGADMLEADVWLRLGNLEIRHVKTIGPLPVYWEKWYIAAVGGPQLCLHELVAGVSRDTRLFLDLKGWHPRLGRRVVETMAGLDAARPVFLCGRNWRQLDGVRHLPNVHVFYSVGERDELTKVWSKLADQAHPAISIHHRLLTEGTLARLKELGTTIIAWTVNDPTTARTLFARGVDGFTSDNRHMLVDIVRRRERAFDRDPAALSVVSEGQDDA